MTSNCSCTLKISKVSCPHPSSHRRMRHWSAFNRNCLSFCPNSAVTAVDLSRASLAYAQRKTSELGITNVKYLQADILNLGELGQGFDIIESAGVLHHMNDPMAGWRVLVEGWWAATQSMFFGLMLIRASN